MQPHTRGLTFKRGAGGGGAQSAAGCEAGLRAPHTQGTLRQASISSSQRASDVTHICTTTAGSGSSLPDPALPPALHCKGAGIALAAERLWEPVTRDHRG